MTKLQDQHNYHKNKDKTGNHNGTIPVADNGLGWLETDPSSVSICLAGVWEDRAGRSLKQKQEYFNEIVYLNSEIFSRHF
jgi:hypothetical protein